MPAAFERTASTYTGTGSAVTVTLGYKPTFVLIFNETDGDSVWFHINGMADASAATILDTGSGTTDLTFGTSNLVTLTSTGFTAGTSLSESGKTFRYFAIR